MEDVLDVYTRPYDPQFPVVCMDETPRQLIKETRTPVPGTMGRLERHDYEWCESARSLTHRSSHTLTHPVMSLLFYHGQVTASSTSFRRCGDWRCR